MQTYYAVNGEEMDGNVTANRFLNKITLALWDKVGIPRPLPEIDAHLVARILKNYASLQRETHKTSVSQQYAFWRELGYNQDDYSEIAWTERTAEFFERSGGLLSEEEALGKLKNKGEKEE